MACQRTLERAFDPDRFLRRERKRLRLVADECSLELVGSGDAVVRVSRVWVGAQIDVAARSPQVNCLDVRAS
jgi:hypothetical protein